MPAISIVQKCNYSEYIFIQNKFSNSLARPLVACYYRDARILDMNQELEELIKELRETHNQKVKSQADLLSSIDRLTKQVADLTEDNMKLQQQIDELLKQI